MAEKSDLTNGRYKPTWFAFVRQLVIFVLGVSILIYSVVSPGSDVPFLVTGLILIGIVPIEEGVSGWGRRH